MTVNGMEPSVWSLSDIEADAQNWTLSSDVNMLQLLNTFSDSLLSRLNSTSTALEELISFSEEVSTKVNNTFNEFNMLSNAQFIESRVYEDDETNEAAPDQLPEVKEEDTSDVIGARIKTSVEYGLTVLDAAYTLHGVIDQDEISEEQGTLLEPNDPYIHRSLPYLIGSSEYCGDDAVGIPLLYQSDDEEGSSKSEDEEEEEEDMAVSVRHTTQDTSSGESESEEEENTAAPAPTRDILLPRDTSRDMSRVASRDVVSNKSSDSEEMFPERPNTSRAKVFDSIFDSTDEEDEEEEVSPPLAPSTGAVPTREERSASLLSNKSTKTPKGVPKGAISIFGGRTVFEDGAIKVIESDEEESNKEENISQSKQPVQKSSNIFSDSDSDDLFNPKNIQEEKEEATPVVSSKKSNKSANKPSDSLCDPSDSEEDEIKSIARQKSALTNKLPDLFGPDDSEEEEEKPAKKPPSMLTGLKKSDMDLFDTSDEDSSEGMFPTPPPKKVPQKKTPQSALVAELSKSIGNKEVTEKKSAKRANDFDDLFGSSDEESPEPTPKKSTVAPEKNDMVPKTRAPAKDDLFDDIFGSEDEDDDFGLPAPKKASPPAKKKSAPPVLKDLDDLFGESSDDEMFGSEPKPPPKDSNTVSAPKEIKTKSPPKETNKPAATKPKARSQDLDDLFGNSDDSDDKAVPPPQTKAANKAPTGKFDDLFADSDENSDDGAIFSAQKQSTEKQPEIAQQKAQKDPPKPLDEVPERQNATQKVQAHANKFDDLFGDSEDESDDMFSAKSENTAIDSRSSNVAKLQSNLNFNPAMLMGGPPPKKASDKKEDSDPLSNEPPKIEDSESDKEKDEPPPISEASKTKKAKFDDLFTDSDDEQDMFAVEKKVVTKSQTPEPKSNIAKLQGNLNLSPDMLMGGPRPKKNRELEVTEDLSKQELPKEGMATRQPLAIDDLFSDDVDDEKVFESVQSSVKTSEKSPESKQKARAAKFDDLFADSEDESAEDMLSRKVPADKAQHTKSSTSPPKEEEKPAVAIDSTPKSKAQPSSNIAKLQNNLNFTPAMLMGQGRPKQMQQATNSEDPASVSDVKQTEDTEKAPTKVLSSITKGRIKRGGRRPPSRAPKKPETGSPTGTTTTSSESATPASAETTASSEPPELPDVVKEVEVDGPKILKDELTASSLPPAFDFDDEDIFSSSSITTRTPSKIKLDDDDIFSEPSKPAQSRISDDLFVSSTTRKPSEDNDSMDNIFAASSKTKSPSSSPKSGSAEDDIFASSPKADSEEDMFAISPEMKPKASPPELNDIFSESPVTRSAPPKFPADSDDIFAASPNEERSRGGMDDIFGDTESTSKSKTGLEGLDDDDLFSAPVKTKKSKKKGRDARVEIFPGLGSGPKVDDDDEIFSETSKSSGKSKDTKSKIKGKKVLDDDLFGDEFDLFSDIPTKTKKKKEKRKNKTESSSSRDFIDPLFQ